jgi:hypothetical protein
MPCPSQTDQAILGGLDPVGDRPDGSAAVSTGEVAATDP